MKYYYKILLALLSFGYLSCSSNSDDDASKYLTVDMGKSSAILIPAPATTLSCEQIAKSDTSSGAIAGSYFTLPNPSISWTGDAKYEEALSEVRVVVLKFTLKSPKVGGEYACVFSDSALRALFYKTTAVVGTTVDVKTWDGRLGKNSESKTLTTRALTAGDATTKFSPCDIKCGGVNVPKGTGEFSVTGEYELLAIQKKYASTAASSDYEEFPIKITGSFTVDNTLR